MKYKVFIRSEFGNAEFEFEANNQEELQKKKEHYKPTMRCPHRETVFIVGLDNDYFEQLW